MDTFIIINWPEIQSYVEREGFDENSCLINDDPFLREYGSCAYFVRKSWIESTTAQEDGKRTKTIHDAPCEPLVLCFNISPYLLDTDERLEILSEMTDEELYKEACEGVKHGLADIYALGDFLGDLNNGELKDKYYYYRYVMVSREESDKWLK